MTPVERIEAGEEEVEFGVQIERRGEGEIGLRESVGKDVGVDVVE